MTAAPDAALGVAWLGMRLARDPARAARLAGGAEALWCAPTRRLACLIGLDAGAGRVAGERSAFRPAAARAELDAMGVTAIASTGPGAPRGLADLADPPPVLFARGPVASVLDALAGRPVVAVVGARRAGSAALAFTHALCGALARRGAVVVSGLALGVDAAAHEGALEADGTTLAVLGGGVDDPTPRRNAALARRMLDAGNVIVSEYWPGTPAAPWRFPARNRIVAALADAVVVVEAGARSGALITADFALELGRAVLAVPGAPWCASARGCNELLRAGAILCEGTDDVVAEVPTRAWSVDDPDGPSSAPGGEGDSTVVVELARAPARADELADALGRTAADIAAELAVLELEGRVLRGEGQRYWAAPSLGRRRELSPPEPGSATSVADARRIGPARARLAPPRSGEGPPARTTRPPPDA